MRTCYALLLERDKYYVGLADNLKQRISQHFSGEGSDWTKLHRPIKLIETIENADAETENKLTIQYMERYGWRNVRGGCWCGLTLSKEPNRMWSLNQSHVIELLKDITKKG